MSSSPFGASREIRLDELLRPLDRRTELAEAWILALALGLPPGRLGELRRTLGHPLALSGGFEVRRADDVILTIPVVQGALLEVAGVIFRLVANGELRSRQPWA